MKRRNQINQNVSPFRFLSIIPLGTDVVISSAYQPTQSVATFSRFHSIKPLDAEVDVVVEHAIEKLFNWILVYTLNTVKCQPGKTEESYREQVPTDRTIL